MVFSVQQGEHGPLVVYKLEIPANTAAAPPVPGQATVTPETPDAPGPAGGVSVLDVLQGLTRAAASVHAEPAPALEWDGEGITLDRVNADISWRRETADRLRRLPFSPRF